MASTQRAADRSANPASPGGAFFTLAAAWGVGYAMTFAWLCATHRLLIDAAGHPLAMDFAQFWSAGNLALHGKALSAYDPHVMHAAEVATVGHPFSPVIGWLYPPLFFFVVAGLASLSPCAAFVAWTSSNLVLHVGTVAAITRRWQALFVAMAAPWVMVCNIMGQDGLLTSAIIGAVLLTLPRRQILSGVLLGFLAYKPQFGLLFPVALAFGGYWRAFLSAAASVAVLTFLSAAVFGFASLPAVVHGIAIATQTHLVTNSVGIWYAFQSVFGLARCLGGRYGLAMGLQLTLAALCAAGVAWLWGRKAIPLNIKAAALCVATLLVTPYVLIWDAPLLGIAVAFLYRERPLDRAEWCMALGAMILVGSHPFVWTLALLGGSYPVGLMAALFIGTLVAKRILGVRTVTLQAYRSPAPQTCRATPA